MFGNGIKFIRINAQSHVLKISVYNSCADKAAILFFLLRSLGNPDSDNFIHQPSDMRTCLRSGWPAAFTEGTAALVVLCRHWLCVVIMAQGEKLI